MNVGGMVAFASGILSFFSPCILPVVPSYLVFISGVAFETFSEAEFRKHRKIVIIHALLFILGFSFVFVALGLTSSFLGKVFSAHQDYVVRIGGAFLVIMGIHLLGLVRIPFLNREKTAYLKERPLGLLGSFLVGATFSFGWTPCVGPVLSSILIMAGTTQQVSAGAYLLSLYSLGLAIPFFLAALLFHRLFLILRKFQPIVRYSTKVLGIILIIVGALLLTDYYAVATSLFRGAWPL
jgi:cytochrome c-type biogenesis protein